MKISKNTLDILKNFATINTNLLVREGNVLATISVQKNQFARAEVPEQFPREFAVYDLNALLQLLTLDADQDVDFGEKSLKITKDLGEFEFFYSDPTIIVAAPNKTIPVEPKIVFDLAASEIQAILKAAAIVQAPVLSFKGDGSTVTAIVSDPATPGSNSYKRQVGTTDQTFNCMIDVERVKIIPEGFKVTINSKFIHLESTSRDLKYWLAVNPSSSI
jgi:hypothetical protein